MSDPDGLDATEPVPSGYLRRVSDARERLIDRIVSAARQYPEAVRGVDIELFIRQYYRHVAAEDLRERKPENLAGAALSHLAFGARREPGSALVRVFNPLAGSDRWESSNTIVQMVNDDMPFLVDSIALVLNRESRAIHLTVHPILRVERDADHRLTGMHRRSLEHDSSILESFVHMEIDREPDPDVHAALVSLIQGSMGDVRAATQDWRVMRQRALDICKELDEAPPPLDGEVIAESQEMLRWMADDHFTFLGYREYRLVREGDEGYLESLPDTGLGILRGDQTTHKSSKNPELTRAIRRQARNKDLLIVTKANSFATVHRQAYLDYVSVKTYDGDRRVDGEQRFLGLFTSVAYSRSPRDIPLLRHKVERVIERSGLPPDSHAGKALAHILDNFPRDELFQATIEDLTRISTGILSLQERQRVKLFVRRDVFRRFVSCLVYVPRDKYNTQVRTRIEELLQKGFDGTSVESTVFISESNLARLHVIVRTPPTAKSRSEVRTIERQIIEAVRTWRDRLRDVMVTRFGEERGRQLLSSFAETFPTAYREEMSGRATSHDIETLTRLGATHDSLMLNLYRPPSAPDEQLRLKLFRRGVDPIPLSDALPMLENMGLRVLSERPYCIGANGDQTVWLQDFEMLAATPVRVDPARITRIFEETFSRVWRGHAENDRFNSLVLLERLTWRQTALLRAICKYLLQAGLLFSQRYIEDMLCRHANIAGMLVTLFETRFDPDCSERTRQRRGLSIAQALDDALDKVATLDADRILRAFLSVLRATLRTNYFRAAPDGEPLGYMSFKLDSRKIPELPRPRPMFEIFVYAPWVEGVHLRGGRVARGGLRWSDRREDFRTEILGLMKAQTVKNTVIVPTGAKGGFVLKPAASGTPDEVREQVLRGYRDFLRGLLDITDNIVDGEIVPPPRVMRQDGDDAYLVVAADKGTATFSDVANGVAESYRFWLGDAFASGGSAGYDHKKMGITAKGAWKAVERHFREGGLDVAEDPFSVAGIGDMSGDVFGNGMLLSPCIRLQAAFNHMHIFLDPDPDPKASFAERARLFALPRSSWTDYDASLISKGGGIFSRADKYIDLSEPVRTMLGISEPRLTPQELIRAILRMQVDLLWNGGIGTYIKSSEEEHTDAGDRANDSVRVDAVELRCRVIGEGGNLGVTQLGRIEYASNGGRINTDFIDNSAGVDCSDHEVNIKILLNLISARRPLTESRRNRLLAAMTDEVEVLVLRNNYLQTQAISMAEATAADRFNEHAHLMRQLERKADLDRALEFLPDEEAIRVRSKAGRGFTRPEIAVLLSYAKINLYQQLCDSDIATDPYLGGELARYFPEPLQERYRDDMSQHRLRREIIANQVTNSIINRMGPAFARRTQDEAGVEAGTLARAYTIARESFDMRSIWADIEGLDNKIGATAQYAMMIQTARVLRRVTLWCLRHNPENLNIAASVARFQPGIAVIAKQLPTLLVKGELRRFEDAAEAYTDIGVPPRLARRMAGLPALYAALDIVDVAQSANVEESDVASIHYGVGAGLRLDWLRVQTEKLEVDGRWQAMARGTLRDNLFDLNRALSARIIQEFDIEDPAAAVSAWLESHVDGVGRTQTMLDEMRHSGALDFAGLSVAVQQIRSLIES